VINLAKLANVPISQAYIGGGTLATNPNPKTISATEASNRFGTMIDEASRGRSLFVVTRMGRPQAVVLGMDQYRELIERLETVDELKDKEYLASIAEAREDIKVGRTLNLEELDKELGFTEEELAAETR
jgi:prevent-host-death family protein